MLSLNQSSACFSRHTHCPEITVHSTFHMLVLMTNFPTFNRNTLLTIIAPQFINYHIVQLEALQIQFHISLVHTELLMRVPFLCSSRHCSGILYTVPIFPATTDNFFCCFTTIFLREHISPSMPKANFKSSSSHL